MVPLLYILFKFYETTYFDMHLMKIWTVASSPKLKSHFLGIISGRPWFDLNLSAKIVLHTEQKGSKEEGKVAAHLSTFDAELKVSVYIVASDCYLFN